MGRRGPWAWVRLNFRLASVWWPQQPPLDIYTTKRKQEGSLLFSESPAPGCLVSIFRGKKQNWILKLPTLICSSASIRRKSRRMNPIMPFVPVYLCHDKQPRILRFSFHLPHSNPRSWLAVGTRLWMETSTQLVLTTFLGRNLKDMQHSKANILFPYMMTL